MCIINTFSGRVLVIALQFCLLFMTDTFASLSGVVQVGNGLQYTSLTKVGGLFDAINSNGLSGDVYALISTDLEEDGAFSLNEWVESGGTGYKLYILPCDTATAVKTITGIASGGFPSFIRFNGADRVIVDGSIFQTGRYLNFVASANSQWGVFLFENGATHDTIRNCFIEAGSINNINTIIFESNTVAGGNSFNGIINNIIQNPLIPIDALPDYCIVSVSAFSDVNCNQNNSILNNEISNFRSGGIKISKGAYCTVSGNSFYNNNTVDFTNGLTIITIIGGYGHRITWNFMGGSIYQCGGDGWVSYNAGFTGIHINNSDDGPPLIINHNTFRNLRLTGGIGEYAIVVSQNANVDSISYNMVGDPDDSASIYIATVSDFAGIKLNYSSGLVRNISNNTISNITCDSSACGTSFDGILVLSASDQLDTLKICKNQISKMYSFMACYSNLQYFNGIENRSSITFLKVSGNVIHDLYRIGNDNTMSVICGVNQVNNNVLGVFEKNTIYKIGNSIEGGYIHGIKIIGSYCQVLNNFISLANTADSNYVQMYGVTITGNHPSIIGNTISIGGECMTLYNHWSACINCPGSLQLLSINNILQNLRTGNGLNYVYIINTHINVTSDYNSLYTSGPWFVHSGNTNINSLIQWKTVSLRDQHSLNFNPVLTDIPNGDLHLMLPDDTVLLQKGCTYPGFTSDIDGDTRLMSKTDIGADEVSYPKICGTLRYRNAAGTEMVSCIVTLLDQNNSIIDYTSTDSLGNFCFGTNQPGFYKIAIISSYPFGGVNAVDALYIMEHFVGMVQIQGLNMEAAKISNDPLINSIDALLAIRRFVGQINSFPTDDWIYDTPSLSFINTNVQLLIWGLCKGDVDGSYFP